jgi:hypothetical protein
MSSSSDHAGAFEKQVTALVEGFCRDFPPSNQEVLLAGQRITVAALLAELRKMEESFAAVHRAQAGLRMAIDSRRLAMKQHRALYEDLVLFLKHHLGRSNPMLTTYGVRLPKARTPLTAEASTIARAKAAATRRARGIVGRRQRLMLGREPEPVLQVFGADGKPLGSVPAVPAEALEEPLPLAPSPSGEGELRRE